MEFKATVKLAGKTATGIEVPEEVVTGLGAGKRPPVEVTVNGYTYRSTIAPRRDRYLLGISGEVRQAAGVAAGDELDVRLELDTKPREVEVPAELAAALAAEPEARRRFEALSYSRRRAYTEPVAQAKTEETRQRRIAKCLAELDEPK